ncbi:MAG TPA: cell division protein FtsL [Candidatus Kapabacteria bacterium]|nr:cell division protein FtsL [Candidatus Kapabacteria bacterium]
MKSAAEQSVLGSSAHTPYRAPASPIVEDEPLKAEPKTEPKKKNGESFEKVVRRIPTLYVITFAAIVTCCAVLIIWNTLQVNRFTLEKTKLEQDIEQAKQRIIKLKAQEMQLSAPDRIRQVAKTKFGMVESDGINEYTIPSQ